MKLRFILSEVGKGLSRNRAMSVAVILVTFVSLLFVGIAGLTQMQVSKMKSEWYDKIEVTQMASSELPTTPTVTTVPPLLCALRYIAGIPAALVHRRWHP